LTIARPDGQSQDIEVDENTSFKKGNESITLPDIKPGDFVRGQGELKNGVFVPKELIVGRGQMRIITSGEGNPPQTPPVESRRRLRRRSNKTQVIRFDGEKLRILRKNRGLSF